MREHSAQCRGTRTICRGCPRPTVVVVTLVPSSQLEGELKSVLRSGLVQHHIFITHFGLVPRPGDAGSAPEADARAERARLRALLPDGVEVEGAYIVRHCGAHVGGFRAPSRVKSGT